MPLRDYLVGRVEQVAREIGRHSYLRVVSGPGTGKTTSLMGGVMLLTEDGVAPDDIFVCTYTRTAARDLDRSLRETGIAGVENVERGTIHSYCFRLLSKEDVLPHLDRIPRPLIGQDFEMRFLLEDLGTEFGGVRACRRTLKAFEAAWARLQSDQPGWPDSPTDRQFHSAMVNWLRFHEAMLIGELIPLALQVLRDNPTIRDRYSFPYVLVDEYQDLNKAEQALLDILAGGGTLSIFGDEDQAIYETMKYAHPEGISGFQNNHEPTHDEDLSECRRCPRSVIRIANSLIAYNADRDIREIIPLEEAPEGEVILVQWDTMFDEATGIAEYIGWSIQHEGVQPGEVLVLSPRRFLGYCVRDSLHELGISAHSFFTDQALDGNPKLDETNQAQQAFSLLTLLANPRDITALRCWCGFGHSNLSTRAWRHLRDYCTENGEHPRDVLDRLILGTIRIPYTNNLIRRYQVLVENEERLSGLVGLDLLNALFPEDDDWAEPFRSLADYIEGGEYSATILREHLRIQITQPELPTDVDYVRIMSLHKAKGLTSRLVIVLGCVQGLIPYVDQDLTPADRERCLAEQRRLFYVAITRPTSTLVISSFVQIQRDLAYRNLIPIRNGDAEYGNTIASAFIGELGPSCPESVHGRDLPPLG